MHIPLPSLGWLMVVSNHRRGGIGPVGHGSVAGAIPTEEAKGPGGVTAAWATSLLGWVTARSTRVSRADTPSVGDSASASATTGGLGSLRSLSASSRPAGHPLRPSAGRRVSIPARRSVHCRPPRIHAPPSRWAATATSRAACARHELLRRSRSASYTSVAMVLGRCTTASPHRPEH